MTMDEYFMDLAIEEALKAEEEGEVPVGAVCVYNNEILSKAHNRVIALKDATAHAEIEAMREAAQKIGNWRIPGVWLYVTIEPCIMCASAMIHFRIERLIYGAKEERWGGVEKYGIFKHSPNHKIEVISGVKEDECKKIIKRFFEGKR